MSKTKRRALTVRIQRAIAEAFKASVFGLRKEVPTEGFIAALRDNGPEAAVVFLAIEPGGYTEFRAALIAGLTAALMFEAGDMKRPRTFVIRVISTTPAIDRWIDRNVTDVIQKFVYATQDGLRETILRMIADGSSPEAIARMVLGSSTAPHRPGSLLGLDRPQMDQVQTMRERLLSGNPVEMRKVFGMKNRDRRSDRSIQKAIDEGRPVPRDLVDHIAGRSADRMFGKRTAGMAVTMARIAERSGMHEAYRQVIDRLGLSDDAVTKIWLRGPGGDDPRKQHTQVNLVEVVGLDEPFIMPDGTPMAFAHDPAGGAKHCANCTCETEYVIDYGDA